MDERDRAVARELTDFAFDQFELYRKHNPAIAHVLDEVVADERFQGELANVFSPILYALQKLAATESLPLISDEAASRAREEWRGLEAAGLIEGEFEYWVNATPDVTNLYFFFLGTHVKPREKPEIYEEAKKIFALILRMIRLERQRRPD